MQNNSQTDWWVLTPDIKGSYINGTWSQIAPMPAEFNYAPILRLGGTARRAVRRAGGNITLAMAFGSARVPSTIHRRTPGNS